MRTGDFLEGVAAELATQLPSDLTAFRQARQGHLLKLWYVNPKVHYEVWPVAGHSFIEVGLHLEAEPDLNTRVLECFDRHIVALTAQMDGAVELARWTASWGHIFHVFHYERLEDGLQAEVVTWLATFVPVAEPILRQALGTATPSVPAAAEPGRPNRWRSRERATRARRFASPVR